MAKYYSLDLGYAEYASLAEVIESAHTWGRGGSINVSVVETVDRWGASMTLVVARGNHTGNVYSVHEVQ